MEKLLRRARYLRMGKSFREHSIGARWPMRAANVLLSGAFKNF